MEPQKLSADDYTAFKTLYYDPFADVHCPRCGSRIKYVVKTRSMSLGNIYDIECSGTPRCFYFRIPPMLTPECIRWHEPDEINAGYATATYPCSSCRVLEYCTVDCKERGQI